MGVQLGRIMRRIVARIDARCAAGIAAAVLFMAPAAGQTVSGGNAATPATGPTPPPAGASPETGEATGATTTQLVSPALGSLADREAQLPPRPAGDVGVRTYAGSGAGVGLFGFSQPPLTLGTRPYVIEPAIQIDVLGTNNLFQTRYDTRSDIVTTIAPSIAGAVSTTRLVGWATYTPALQLYNTYSNQNSVYQNGGGQLLAAVIPGLFYVDMRGAANVVPQLGGVIPGSGQVISSNNATQTFNAQITPFLYYRFGTAATAQLGYSYQYSQQDSVYGRTNFADPAAQSFSANRGFAVLRSGEDFGRLALQGRIDGTSFIGNGVYDGAHRFITSVEGRYSIIPTIAVLGEIGYENIEYGGTNPATITGATWSIGARMTPSPDSIIVIRYGRHEGFDSVSLNAGVALGVRTNLYATYSERLTTSLSQSQDLLETTTLDALGNPVDSQSGAPILLVNPFLGVSNALYRMRLATVTLRQNWERDTFTLSGAWQDSEPVSSAPGSPAAPQTGGYATFSWAHELTSRTTGIATLQYGRITQNQYVSNGGNIYSASLTLVHRLAENLSATAQIAWYRDNSLPPDLRYTQSVVRAALRRSF